MDENLETQGKTIGGAIEEEEKTSSKIANHIKLPNKLSEPKSVAKKSKFVKGFKSQPTPN